MGDRYAHIVIENNIRIEQTVYEHCRDTANFTKSINITPDLHNIVYLSSLLHDVGKATDAFSEYLEKAVTENKKDKKVNHSSAGAKFFLECLKNQNRNLNLFDTILCESIISHHGLNDFIKPDGINQFSKRCYPEADIEFQHVLDYINEHFDMKELVELYEKAEKEFEYVKQVLTRSKQKVKKEESVIVLKFYLNALVRQVLSILIDADREDTRSFCLQIPSYTYPDTNIIWNRALKKLEEELTTFSSGGALNKIRLQISDECKQAAMLPSGVYKLSCPTGSGKTLSSLRYALYHAERHGKRHIFYIAPYKTVLEQNASVFKKFFSQQDVLEHHSNIIPESKDEYQYLNSSWSTPVILTTAVQFYQTLFSDSTTSIRRFHQLADAVIIIDEAQTTPINMTHMFNCMLNYLSEICGATILLCTATQPVFDKIHYPLHYMEHAEIADKGYLEKKPFQRVHVINACTKGGFDLEEYSDFIMQCQEKHNTVLTIVNTKSEARELYQRCKELVEATKKEVKLFHLTTSMCPQHRNNVLQNIKNHLQYHESIICIATNLVECGVDMSFQCVIRSLTGLDSIMQAAGRCNRNKEVEFGYVYLVKSNTERIGKLDAVKHAQLIMLTLLSELEEEDGYIDALLSSKIMEKYYEVYYKQREDIMQYPFKVRDISTSQMECWTERTQAVATLDQNDKFKPCLHSSLKTAGEHLEIIAPTIGILVPYSYESKHDQVKKGHTNSENEQETWDGKTLIAKLNSSISDSEKYQLLPYVQRFTIQVYENQCRNLVEQGIVSVIAFGDIHVLVDDYYDNDIGLNIAADLNGLFE